MIARAHRHTQTHTIFVFCLLCLYELFFDWISLLLAPNLKTDKTIEGVRERDRDRERDREKDKEREKRDEGRRRERERER